MDLGFKKHVHKTCPVKKHQHDFDKKPMQVYLWMFSQAQPGYCEAKEELVIFKGYYWVH
jgi:hypothetical protein